MFLPTDIPLTIAPVNAPSMILEAAAKTISAVWKINVFFLDLNNPLITIKIHAINETTLPIITCVEGIVSPLFFGL